MTTVGFTPEQNRFVEEVAALLVPWGMPPSLARLYAYLLLCSEPVGLDTIAADLGIAKSSTSVAVRTLEHYGLARRYGQPGTKRVRFGPSESYSGYIVSQAAVMGDIGRLVEARARSVAKDDTLRRLRYLAAFFRKMEATILGRVAELTDEFARQGPDDDLK